MFRDLDSRRVSAGQSRQAALSQFFSRLEPGGELQGHRGCVNTLRFSEQNPGLLLSGSDDQRMMVWDVTRRSKVCEWKTKHRLNILSSTFMPHSNDQTIVTAGMDGAVVVHTVGQEFRLAREGRVGQRRVFMHKSRAHKVCAQPDSPNVFWSAGEDGALASFDLRVRDDAAQIVLLAPSLITEWQCSHRKRYDEEMSHMAFYSVAIHPTRPHEIAVSGESSYVAVCDARIGDFCQLLADPERRSETMTISGVAYDSIGSALLASYHGGDIVEFETPSMSTNRVDEVARRYRGHRNAQTIKHVMYGPEDLHVVSGSDDGHAFFFNRVSTDIECIVPGDETICNAIAIDPSTWSVCTAGLDSSIKVLDATAEKPFDVEDAREIIDANLASSRHTISLSRAQVMSVLTMLNSGQLSEEDQADLVRMLETGEVALDDMVDSTSDDGSYSSNMVDDEDDQDEDGASATSRSA